MELEATGISVRGPHAPMLHATSLSVATLLVNSMPTVIAASPGLLDNLTIAMHGGGYVPE